MTTTVQPSSLFTPPLPRATQAGLTSLRALFDQLDADAVPYCHWKSNEHLGASMAGAADLDLLVARGSALPFARILADRGFKRFAAASGSGYPGVEDYLGFDYATGSLTHLHVHYELTLGEQYLKGYRIPWERQTLERRVRDAQFGVWCADPASELLLLVLRAALKLRWRDQLMNRGRAHALPAGMEREMRWLLARTNADAVAALATERLGPQTGTIVKSLLEDAAPTAGGLRALRSSTGETLGGWRTFGATDALVHRWSREFWSRLRPARRALGGMPRRRVLPRGGALIGFVGADGSGKSTLAHEIERWLAWKLDVVRVYGGSGVNSAGLPRWLMEHAARLTRRFRSRRPCPPVDAKSMVVPSRQPSDDEAIEGYMPRAIGKMGLGRIGWIVALARERRQRAQRSRRARNQGMVVLSDRLAQSQFAAINDGPLLGDPAQRTSAIRRAAARYETDAFRAAERVGPDLVIRLLIPFEVAARRKPDTPPNQLRVKLAIVRRLRWPPDTQVVDIDATRALADVLLDVKRAVWEVL